MLLLAFIIMIICILGVKRERWGGGERVRMGGGGCRTEEEGAGGGGLRYS